MAPRDKLCLFKKGSSGEIPVKWEGEACQKLWNLSRAPGRFPAVGVKHTIHLICILFQAPCCSAKAGAAAGSSGARCSHCTRAQPLCWHLPGVAHGSSAVDPRGDGCSSLQRGGSSDLLPTSEAEGFLCSVSPQAPVLVELWRGSPRHGRTRGPGVPDLSCFVPAGVAVPIPMVSPLPMAWEGDALCPVPGLGLPPAGARSTVASCPGAGCQVVTMGNGFNVGGDRFW